MKKYISVGVGLLLGAAIGTTGFQLIDQQLKPKDATAIVGDRKSILKDIDEGLASCPIENLTKQKIIVKVISSKFASGNYYVEPKDRALLSCGDVVRIESKDFTTKIQLTKPIAVQFGQKVQGQEI
jgi:hypothetical protein